jgi:hypothetical protein
MSEVNTPYSNRCNILSNLYLNYKDEEDFADFVEYNDLGLPLAHFIAEGIVSTTPMAEQYINETWNLFMGSLGIEDTGFSDLEEIFITVGIED